MTFVIYAFPVADQQYLGRFMLHGILIGNFVRDGTVIDQVKKIEVKSIRSLFTLKECPDLTFYGLFVRGNQGRRIIEVPIAIIEEVQDEGKNKQLIADYCLWFWNYR